MPNLLELHRDLDTQETMLAIIVQWPEESQLEYLRDSLRERIAETDVMLEQTKRILGEGTQ